MDTIQQLEYNDYLKEYRNYVNSMNNQSFQTNGTTDLKVLITGITLGITLGIALVLLLKGK